MGRGKGDMAYPEYLLLREGTPCAGLWLSCRLQSRLRKTVISLKGSKGRGGRKSLLGITKSGTSAKGEMRLVPKPDGICGGLERNGVVSGASCTMGSWVTNPLYSFRYNGSAPAVYSSKLSEQVALSFFCTLVLHQSWKMVLFSTACVSVEAG